MKKINLLLFITCLSLSAQAALYKHTNEDGEVTYSDAPPFAGAREMNAPALQRTPSVKYKPKEEEKAEEEKEKAFKYLTFAIDQPKNDETIRSNDGSIIVMFKLIPELNTKDGHYINVYVDGQLNKKQTQNLTVTLTDIDRGSHNIKAEIKNKQGKLISSTGSTLIHLHRLSKLHGLPKPPKPVVPPTP